MTNLPVVVEQHRSRDLALLVQEVETWDDNVALARHLNQVGTACQWALGDLAVKAVGPDGHHDTLRSWAEEVGCSKHQAKDWHMTARAFSPVERSTTHGWGVHRILAGDPERGEKLATLPDGATAREARDMRGMYERDDMTAEEQLASAAEARTAAANAADARTPASVKQHGATPGNETEQAYERRIDDVVRQGEKDKAAEDRLYEAREWEKVDDTTSYAPPPTRRPVGNLDNVPGMVALLDDLETAVANLDYLGEREAGLLLNKLLSVSEMVAEVQRASQEAA